MFSLIVPYYNREKLLPRLLDSLQRVTLKPALTVFVNNGSKDGSAAIIDRFIVDHPNFPTLHILETTPGAAAARNAGLNHVTTEWVYFFDSDDELSPRYFQEISDIARRHPDRDIIASRTMLVFPNERKKTKESVFTDRLTDQINTLHLATQNMFLRTDFLKNAGGWNERMRIWDDWELGIRLIIHGAKVYWTKRIYHRIYQHADTLTGNDYSSRLEQIEEVLREVNEELTDCPDGKRALLLRAAIIAGRLRKEGNQEGAKRIQRFARDIRLPERSFIDTLLERLLYRLTAAGLRGTWRIACLFERIR